MTPYKNYTLAQKKELHEKLLKADSVGSMLNVLYNEFDLYNCKPGKIIRATLAGNLVNVALPMINPTKK